MVETDVDVAVIGSGAAGLAAAVSAHEAGARRILVAESEKVIGGSSRLSSGVVMASGSQLQRAAGIVDSPEEFLRDYLFLNNFDVSIGPVTTLVQRSGETIDWLIQHGAEFSPSLIYSGAELTKRGHLLTKGGQGAVDVLERRCRALGIDLAVDRRVDRLLVDGDRIAGLAVGGDEIRAGAVVIASGGFGANPDRVAAHFPSASFEGWSWYIGADGARGDALDFAAQAGAETIGHDHGLRTLTPKNPFRILEAFQPG